jgi:hypothetical protein
VYSNKRQLKQNKDGIFVTENLTQLRTSMPKTLLKLKYEHKIHAYWTSDGRYIISALLIDIKLTDK